MTEKYSNIVKASYYSIQSNGINFEKGLPILKQSLKFQILDLEYTND